MHRHHISYKSPQVIIKVPAWYHWCIHVPGSLLLSGTSWWTGKPSQGAVYWQNRRAKGLGLKWLLGYPNPIQVLMHVIGWIAWNL